MVWLEATNIRIPGKPAKLSPKRFGPFPITNKLSNLVYRLKLPPHWRIHPVFHASLLTPYIETEAHGPNDRNPPPDIVEGEEEYEIEALVNHRKRGKQHHFLVKWKGYDDSYNSWTAISELRRNAKDILQQYIDQNNLSIQL